MSELDVKNLSVEDLGSMSDEEFEKHQGAIEAQLQNEEAPVVPQEQNQVQEQPQQEIVPEQQQVQTVQETPTEGTQEAPESTPNEQIEQPTTMTAEEFQKFLTSPFRANNADVQVDDPKDIRRLMQMGMNYQKKLGKIRPHLGALKSLEQNGLLDSDKLSFAIDLMNHKPEAIAQLIKESGVDTYNLPDVTDKPYQAPNHIMDAKTVEFNEAVDEANENEYGRTVLTNLKGWDDKSKEMIYDNPNLINTLSEQVQSGLFQDTMAIIQREQALGKIPSNVSMIEAYNTVATQLLNTDEKYTKPSHWGGSYNPNKQVVGNNIQQPQNIQQSGKYQAGIPNTVSTSINPTGVYDLNQLAQMDDAELANFTDFDSFVRKNNIRFK